MLFEYLKNHININIYSLLFEYLNYIFLSLTIIKYGDFYVLTNNN